MNDILESAGFVRPHRHDALVGSVFLHKLDNQPRPIMTPWAELVDLLRDLSVLSRAPSEKDGVRDKAGRWLVRPSAPAICPAEYPDGALRRKVNVQRWHWFGGDIDNDGSSDYLAFSDMETVVQTLELAHILHTTTKSRPGRDRYRLLVPLVRPIEAFEFARAWNAINQFFGGVFDSATHDQSRLLFAPAAWEGSNLQFVAAEGGALDIDTVMEAFPAPVVQRSVSTPVAEALSQQVRQLAQAQSLTAWARPTVGAAAFLTPEMERTFLAAPEGGRFMRLMTQIAMHAIGKGYPIDAIELASVAEAFDLTATGKRREGVAREAERALAFAVQALASPPSFEARYARNLKRFAGGR